MKKLSKKALFDAIKNDFLLGSDILSVHIRSNNEEETKYVVCCKDYQVTVYQASFGVSGWFSGELTMIRMERLIKVLKTFDED